MALDQTRERLVAELAPPLASLGLDLEGVELRPAGRRRLLRVAVDKDGGVTVDDVAEATKEVSRLLDGSDAMGEHPYTLEVSSPGVDRPLTHPRHWRRNEGRLVEVSTAAGESLTGRVVAVADDAVTVSVDGSERAIPLDQVARAVVQVELNPRGGAGAGQPTGRKDR